MIRVGLGYDFHQFSEGRRLMLGGVEVPFVKGLSGHSDADVILHSICDALLGALGKGDIGEHFPNTDESFRDVPSSNLLKDVVSMVKKERWQINNIDVMVVMQEPKLQPFKEKIRQSIAGIAGIDKERVNIKATTTELVGSIGRSEAAASQAVVLIEKRT
ncbi:MAG: 2-C-methyl-D-erythritol 2,4-cyclodiphosphate synthase [Candidatus Omnitrophica bacterium]|nr:2-C-methyl-D-erythritol 2,4-cyclodiphosphate synthase [Candidatus Omnitrophota bacterium]